MRIQEFLKEFVPLWYMGNADLYLRWVHQHWWRFSVSKSFCSN